ncbi:MAG: hypothetical protein GXP25_12005 [Planctomycetes bacterium]|nr:hypothetical protein [Planctomycetota bacterium]
MTKHSVARRVVVLEIAGFSGVIFFVWMNEILDLPYHLFGAFRTKINIRESLFETVLMCALAAVVVLLTMRLIKQIKYLEGFLPVCAFCKKIRVGEKWIPLEDYLDAHTEAKLSHGYCPECVEKHYGTLMSGKKTPEGSGAG